MTDRLASSFGIVPPPSTPGFGVFSRNTVPNRQELRRMIGKRNDAAFVIDSIGAQTFYYSTTSLEPDDGLNVIRPTAIAEDSPGRWISTTRFKMDAGRAFMPAGTTEIAIVFNLEFFSTPTVSVTLEKPGSIQGIAIQSLNANGFLVRRSSAAGDAYINWHGIGI